MDPRDNRDPFEYQELRLALAMSGGVSLAIWMGGVAMEIYRVVRADPLLQPSVPTDELAAEVYGGLLDLTRSTPRVDVISGASAGGLNGAFLAMAMVHRSDLGALQSLWLDKASLTKLLRSPLQIDPPSLLKGDEYFLPELRSAFARLQQGPLLSPDDVPIRLIMTTTLLNADARTFADDLGSLLPDAVHAGQFRFQRGAGIAEDDFARGDILDRLARAARSTASFPGAFEASFVRIGEEKTRYGGPDMKENADFDESRFVVDGAVLVNKPIGPALRAIFAQPAGGQAVRRVFAYVVPDPGVAGVDRPDPQSDPPSLGRVVLRSLVTVPRSESVAGDLQSLTEHNRRARGQQLLRDRLLRPPDQGADLARLAQDLFGSYRKLRATNIVDGVLETKDPLEVHEAGLADEAVRILRWLVGTGRTPWMPTGEGRQGPQPGWPWGGGALESVGIVALDLVRQAVNLCRPRIPELAEFRQPLGEVREAIHADLVRVGWLRRRERDDYLQTELNTLLTDLGKRRGDPAAPDLQGWLERWMEGRDRFESWLRAQHPDAPDPEQLARELASRLVQARPLLLQAVDVALRTVTRDQERDEWESLRRRVENAIPGNEDDTLRVLIDLAIVQHTFTAGMPVLEQPVDFVQISANAPNGLDDRATVGKKVAGIQLGHFGSFYKSSWRANDWMWGRLDGAMRLTQVLLNPARLRERIFDEELSGETAVDWAVERIEELALPNSTADAESREVLEPLWEQDSARKELSFLAIADGPVPGSLPICAGAIARRIQLDVLRTELHQVAGAIESDRHEGAVVSSEARRFADGVKAATAASGRLAPRDADRLFRLCRVGEERIGDDAGSDLFTTTAAQAAAVGVSAGAGAKGGLGPLRGVLRSVRNLFLAMYVLARSAVRGRGGFALATILLAVGGAIIAVGFVEKDLLLDGPGGVGASNWFDWLGITLVAAGVLLMAIRAGLPLTAAYVAVAAVLAWWPYAHVRDNYAAAAGFRGWLYSIRFAIPIAVLVIAAVGLGFVKRNRWWQSLAIAAVLAWVGLVAFFAVRDFRQPKLWLVIAAPATTMAVGFGLAWWIKRDREARSRRSPA